jgi:hypothetical protein
MPFSSLILHPSSFHSAAVAEVREKLRKELATALTR